MNEPSTPDAPVLGGSVAFGLGALLLVGVALVLALAIFDRQRRVQIEGWEEVTAVGDVSYFTPPAPSAAPALVTWDAGVLKIASAERVKLRDTQMRRAGRDQAAGITIYRHIAKEPAGFYVKIAPDEYLPALP